MPQYKVAFNKDQKEMYDKLKEKGLTSKPFPVFVRDAFYDKFDKISLKKIKNN